MTGPLLATALTVVALGVLLAAERARGSRLAAPRRAHRVRYLAKPVASLGFVLVPLTGDALTRPGIAPVAIVAGLVLGAVGDVLLLGRRRAAFAAGLTAFLFGHVAYVIAFAGLVPPARWLERPMPLVIAAVAIASGAVLRWLWLHLGSLKGPVVAYVAVIGTMLVGAVACAYDAKLGETTRLLTTLGAALFFASDLAVARDRFIVESFVNRAWGLPAYYAGQLCLAWSSMIT